MQMNYCDLCSIPLKSEDHYVLYLAPPGHEKRIAQNDIEGYNSFVKKVQEEIKEICPNCKDIFDRIFELRLHRLSELTTEINYTYNLPTKKNIKERKDDKKKKQS